MSQAHKAWENSKNSLKWNSRRCKGLKDATAFLLNLLHFSEAFFAMTFNRKIKLVSVILVAAWSLLPSSSQRCPSRVTTGVVYHVIMLFGCVWFGFEMNSRSMLDLWCGKIILSIQLIWVVKTCIFKNDKRITKTYFIYFIVIIYVTFTGISSQLAIFRNGLNNTDCSCQSILYGHHDIWELYLFVIPATSSIVNT